MSASSSSAVGEYFTRLYERASDMVANMTQPNDSESRPLLHGQSSAEYGATNDNSIPVPKPRKVVTPIKVEAKRTWISWLRASLLIGTLALALFNSASYYDPVPGSDARTGNPGAAKMVRGFGIVYAMISVFILLWGLYSYQRRVTLIKMRWPGSFDDLIGPPLVCGVTFIAILANFIIACIMVTVNLGTVYKGSPSGKIIEAQGADRELRPNDVVIDIAYSGLCGTDLHYRKADMVLGHEGVGVVSQVGPAVTKLKVGDHVGWGYNHGSCGYCDHCWNGFDILCADRQMYGYADLDFGSFGDRAVLDALFVHKLPEGMDLSLAGPLQCGGATVYSAIVNAEVKMNERVAVLGLGGLGHLAIQYLAKMGCDVVVFSGSENKKQQAMELGANEFVATKTNPTFEGVKPVNHLLVSTSFQPDWEQYFKVLAPRAKIVPLTVSFEEMKHPYAELVFYEYSITGSVVARRLVHRQMLEFSARNNIKPIVEFLTMDEAGVNEAFDRLDKGDVRYRFVLKNPRFKSPV
ncbi:alcohol dehydrogenase (NADP(+)) [Malassezia caprae]|uniref:Alcohol dehydrogenase (NADP(+)) n=1 Tax=Malassezia caprae TaxID=1381934 RepID=A0AAF0E9T3_9BASI|nr:alcohol dehydrogenase (NADP(+)) [Malassezia caprae]